VFALVELYTCVVSSINVRLTNRHYKHVPKVNESQRLAEIPEQYFD